jgi:hypothetical protein
MELTRSECNLLINIVNAGITRAIESGIPIGKEYYKDIDSIKNKLYKELAKGGSKT